MQIGIEVSTVYCEDIVVVVVVVAAAVHVTWYIYGGGGALYIMGYACC